MNELRLKIDRVAQLVEQLAAEQYHKTTSVHLMLACNSKLRMAKAWCGLYSGYEYDTESPYKNEGNRKDVQDIEPTDAVANVPVVDDSTLYGQKNYIEKIDYLRGQIKILVEEVEKIQPTKGREASIARTNIFNYLCESRFELGFQLQQIREKQIA